MEENYSIRKDLESVFGFILLYPKVLIVIPIQFYTVINLIQLLARKAVEESNTVGIFLIDLFFGTLPFAVLQYALIIAIKLLFLEKELDYNVFKKTFLKSYKEGITIFIIYLFLIKVGFWVMMVVGVIISIKLYFAPFLVVFDKYNYKEALLKSSIIKINSTPGRKVYLVFFLLTLPLLAVITLLVMGIEDFFDFQLFISISQIIIDSYCTVFLVAGYMYYLRFKSKLVLAEIS